MERRAAWLRATVNELGLSNVDVLRERAEEHRKKYRIVTARAVAPLRNLITLAEPLLSQDSQSAGLFIKGQNAAAEIAEAGKVIQRMNRGHPQLLILGRELGADSLTVVRIQGSE
jgi:16S rRNA (guanine527-N7)-methyltransferase